MSKAKFETEKEEMIHKLKDIGETVLNKFGMSIRNFEMVHDSKTGGYSFSYKQQQ